jgi:transcriptional regulator with XRE-family HTH domain
MSLGARIKAFRNYLGLKQDEFAEKINTRMQASVSSWENDKQNPDTATTTEMGKLGVNLNWLLLGEGNMLKDDFAPINSDFDADLMGKVIIILEEALNERNLKIAPDKKARAILEMYKFAVLYDEPPPRDNIIKLLKIA